ncbi:MAG: cytochrome c family protein [candidate division WOR-3 bacterium]
MKKIIYLSITIGILSLYAEEAKKFEYVKSTTCKMCHKSEARGNQWGIWENSNHAKAFETLKTDKAKEIAKKMKIDDPSISEKCVTCHNGWDGEEGVGCQDCHGPGSEYKSMQVMKDLYEKKIKPEDVGLIRPNEEYCKKCHNPDSPTYKEFKYAEFFEKIKHPVKAQ